MTDLNQILQEFRIRVPNTAFFPPADSSKIDFSDAMLKNGDAAPVPADYAEFLKVSNGMVSSLVEFYGTAAVDRAGKAYRFPNLVEVNEALAKSCGRLLSGSVQIGTAFLDIILYDAESGRYMLVSRLNFGAARKFASLRELLSYLLGLV